MPGCLLFNPLTNSQLSVSQHWLAKPRQCQRWVAFVLDSCLSCFTPRQLKTKRAILLCGELSRVRAHSCSEIAPFQYKCSMRSALKPLYSSNTSTVQQVQYAACGALAAPARTWEVVSIIPVRKDPGTLWPGQPDTEDNVQMASCSRSKVRLPVLDSSCFAAHFLLPAIQTDL